MGEYDQEAGEAERKPAAVIFTKARSRSSHKTRAGKKGRSNMPLDTNATTEPKILTAFEKKQIVAQALLSLEMDLNEATSGGALWSAFSHPTSGKAGLLIALYHPDFDLSTIKEDNIVALLVDNEKVAEVATRKKDATIEVEKAPDPTMPDNDRDKICARCGHKKYDHLIISGCMNTDAGRKCDCTGYSY